MLLGMGVLVALCAVIGIVLVRAFARLSPDDSTDVERVNALLPQTQCGQCGFPGCRPYAEALVQARIGIDRCPPGGASTRRALGALLAITDTSQPPAAGAEGRATPRVAEARLAIIDESACIGCTRCIEVCPVDAIVGASRYSHTVIAADCTGCELCVPACPVDCIALLPARRTSVVRMAS